MQAQSLPYAAHDLARAMPDYITARTSFEGRDDLDPVGLNLATYERASLLDLAVGIVRPPAGLSGVELQRVLTVSDFVDALAGGLSKPLTAAYIGASAESGMVLYDMPAQNFQPTALPIVDVGELSGPDGPLSLAPLVNAAATTTGRPFTWSAQVSVARQVLVNDDIGLLTALVASFGVAAASIDDQRVAAVLQANAALGDGVALFASAKGNDLTTTSLNVAGLNDGFEALRVMATPAGRRANLPAAVLLVPPSEIATAKVLLAALDGPPKLASNAWLPSGSRYLFASPTLAPTLVRLRLTRSKAGPSVERVNIPDYDGFGLRVLHDVGIVASNRVGVVRMTD